jgi:hypothetical protein
MQLLLLLCLLASLTASAATPETLTARTTEVRVTLLLNSGKPDPSWLLQLPENHELVQGLKELPHSSQTKYGVAKTTPNYRGFTVATGQRRYEVRTHPLARSLLQTARRNGWLGDHLVSRLTEEELAGVHEPRGHYLDLDETAAVSAASDSDSDSDSYSMDDSACWSEKGFELHRNHLVPSGLSTANASACYTLCDEQRTSTPCWPRVTGQLNNTDFYGDSMLNKTVSSPQKCSTLCNNQRQCQAWTFSASSSACTLKSSTEGKYEATGRVAGFRNPCSPPVRGHSDAAPMFNPTGDGCGLFVRNVSWNNCYNYATDIATNTFAQPGKLSGTRTKNDRCSNVLEAIVGDGLKWHGAELPAEGLPDEGRGHYIALWTRLGSSDYESGDFHFARRDHNGLWSHKPGTWDVTNVDDSGALITNPSKANFSYYDAFCGYLTVVPSDVHIL